MIDNKKKVAILEKRSYCQGSYSGVESGDGMAKAVSQLMQVR